MVNTLIIEQFSPLIHYSFVSALSHETQVPNYKTNQTSLRALLFNFLIYLLVLYSQYLL